MKMKLTASNSAGDEKEKLDSKTEKSEEEEKLRSIKTELRQSSIDTLIDMRTFLFHEWHLTAEEWHFDR